MSFLHQFKLYYNKLGLGAYNELEILLQSSRRHLIKPSEGSQLTLWDRKSFPTSAFAGRDIRRERPGGAGGRGRWRLVHCASSPPLHSALAARAGLWLSSPFVKSQVCAASFLSRSAPVVCTNTAEGEDAAGRDQGPGLGAWHGERRLLCRAP